MARWQGHRLLGMTFSEEQTAFVKLGTKAQSLHQISCIFRVPTHCGPISGFKAGTQFWPQIWYPFLAPHKLGGHFLAPNLVPISGPKSGDNFWPQIWCPFLAPSLVPSSWCPIWRFIRLYFLVASQVLLLRVRLLAGSAPIRLEPGPRAKLRTCSSSVGYRQFPFRLLPHVFSETD